MFVFLGRFLVYYLKFPSTGPKKLKVNSSDHKMYIAWLSVGTSIMLIILRQHFLTVESQLPLFVKWVWHFKNILYKKLFNIYFHWRGNPV